MVHQFWLVLFPSYTFKTAMDTIIQSAKNKLVNGEDGRSVVEYLRTTFVKDQEEGRERKLSSLHNLMTDVRSSFKGEVLPPSMETFKLTRDEVVSLKQGHELAQLHKNEHLLVIPDATALLTKAEELLLSASPSHSNPRLLLPLLLVSGRRLSEMTSPRVSYTPVAEHAYYCTVVGILKKRQEAFTGCIPLLVPWATFKVGLNAWRQKQRADTTDKRRLRAKKALDELTNKELKVRYDLPMTVAIQRNYVFTLPMYMRYNKDHDLTLQHCKVHDLRAIYAAFVFALYECDESFNRAAMRACLHDSLSESLSYSHVRLDGTEGLHDCLGPLLK